MAKFTNKRVYLLIGAVVILAFISMYAVYSTEGFKDSSGGAEFYLVYAEWCPHCKTIKPIVADMASKYREINGKPIKIEVVNGETDVPILQELPKVKGYPSFFFRKDGFTEEYKGGRDEESIVEFLKSKL
jgi:thiol-disulfide isomerase/thioredoxin